jgi:chromosome partitioning protein
MGRERFLARALPTLAERFDVVLLDSPPSLGLLTINCLAAAQLLFIPVAPALLSAAGLRDLLTTVEEIRQGIHPGLRIGGVFITFADRTLAAKRGEADLREDLGKLALQVTISRRVAHEYAAHAGKPSIALDPEGIAAGKYRQLTEEIWSRVERIAEP